MNMRIAYANTLGNGSEFEPFRVEHTSSFHVVLCDNLSGEKQELAIRYDQESATAARDNFIQTIGIELPPGASVRRERRPIFREHA